MRFLLNGHGRTLADFNLPEPDERGLNWRNVAIPQNFEDMNPEEHRTIALQLEATLNIQQRVSITWYFYLSWIFYIKSYLYRMLSIQLSKL